MIGAAEIARAIRGAFRLLRLDPRGLDDFDATLEGFWRSFTAAFLTAPAYAVLVVLEFSAKAGETGEIDWFRVFAVRGIAFVIGWVAFPLVMHTLAQAMGRSGAYFRFMVAYNWASVPQMILYLPVELARSAWPEPAAPFALIALAAILFYQWFIARTALAVSGLLAGGVVAVDVVLSLAIAAVADALI
ncbi:MAG: hypothetical protein U1F33_17650 [Alphaproteobacteria bacterium]